MKAGIARVMLLMTALATATPGCAAPGRRTAKSEAMETTALASAKPIELGPAPSRAELASLRAGETLASRAASLRSGRKLYVLVRGLRVVEDPGVIYDVYLDLPAGAKPVANDARHIGTINFYGVPPASAASADRVYYSFDITGAVRALRAKGALPEATSVTFVPEGPASPAGKATIARVEIIEE